MAKQDPAQPIPPPVEITAAGSTPEAKQANLITARQSPAFYFVAEILADSIIKRVEQVLLDYTRDQVGVRYQIDGLWHNLPPRDRESGDMMLAALKKIADLDFNERKARQEGEFEAVFQKLKCKCTLTSQGVATGERVVLRIARKGEKDNLQSLEDLGMRPKMREQLKEMLERQSGFLLFSSPPGGGLRTSWSGGLNAADRLIRDFVSIEDENNLCDEVINVDPVTFNISAGESPTTVLPKIMLKEPDVLVVPELTNAESLEKLCDLVSNEEKLVFSRIRAKESVEALLRVLMLKAPAKKFAKVITAVVNQRLVRRLCSSCRQAYQPQPQLLQRLGIPAGRVQMLYREFQPPPPEQLVDEKGKPIPPPFCHDCNALGYKGRIAIYELLIIDDSIRQALVKQPKLDVLRQLARKAGNRTLQEEGILLVASGVTSLAELQRVLKQ